MSWITISRVKCCKKVSLKCVSASQLTGFVCWLFIKFALANSWLLKLESKNFIHNTEPLPTRQDSVLRMKQGHHELKVLLSHQVFTLTVRGCCPLANPDLWPHRRVHGRRRAVRYIFPNFKHLVAITATSQQYSQFNTCLCDVEQVIRILVWSVCKVLNN